MNAQFRHIMLMVTNVPASVQFYAEGLGLTVIKASPTWAELDAHGTTIALHGVDAGSTPGSSPILSFHVEDVYAAIAHLEPTFRRLTGNKRCGVGLG